MTSIHTRPRDPLFAPETQAILSRRLQEFSGLCLLVLAIGSTLMLGSYSPEDPGWLAATDTPAQNLLGRAGASAAAALMVIVGYAAWLVPLFLAAWGGRLLLHIGAERVLPRATFAVIVVALCAIFAATLPPPHTWPHSFGLGGLFGDTLLGLVLGLIPAGVGSSLLILSLAFGTISLFSGLWIMAVTRGEVVYLGRLCLRAVGNWIAHSSRKQQTLPLAHEPSSEFNAAPMMGAHNTQHGAQQQPPQQRRGRLSRLWGLMTWRARPAPARAASHPIEIELSSDSGRTVPSLRRPEPVLYPGPELVSLRFEAGGPGAIRAGGPLVAHTDDARIKERIAGAIRARHMSAARGDAPLSPEVLHDDLAELSVYDEGEFFDDAPLETMAPPLDDDPPLTPILRPVSKIGGGSGAFSDKGLVQPPQIKSHSPSQRAQSEAQPQLRLDNSPENMADNGYELPPLSLLAAQNPLQPNQKLSNEALEENARMLESVLDDYGVRGEIISVRPGPVVTMYELEPAPGLKASRVIGLADDIARSMSALSARVSTVPGRSVIGIELPNLNREKVALREILSARDFGDSTMRLPLALGKDISGSPIVANLAKMPHLLIAGTTGSGKSVAINTMILSLLYKLTPDECRLIMIDPKMLELSVYDGIPHLLSPVVTDPKKAIVALKWVVGEMEERYRKMSKMGVRNIDGYNARVRDALSKGEMFKRTIQTGFDEDTGDPVFETDEFEPKAFPYIVVIVDEMADLMMVAGKEIEACIQRLAQMARASGIHLIMATQRPSVDVITGTIKANFPTRISFQVTSKIDSRTILGEQGAEQLLGMGDMLYMGNGARITRIHGPFVSDEEVEEVVNHLKSFGPPQYMSSVVEGPEDDKASDIDQILGLGGGGDDGEAALYDQAVAIVARDRKCSTSYIQRKLGIGYNKAARLVEQMEDQGIVTTANHVGKREILIPEN